MKYTILILTALLFSKLNAQPNCKAFKYYGDTLQYKACEMVKGIDEKYYQFSREFQQAYDKAIEVCPYFAYGYKEKSVAYLKSGDFINWKILIDKAVKYNKEDNLGYRGWCRFQFFKDYKGAIADFQELETLVKDIGYSANGDYHLQIAKAICYSALGEKERAIEIIKRQLSQKDYPPGWFDYYQLGVTYFELKDYSNAMVAFQKQDEIHPLAENLYYIYKIYKIQNNIEQAEISRKQAIELYKQGKFMIDPYTHHFNKVYLAEIEKE